MDVVDPRTFVAGEIFREREFREAIQKFNWAQFKDKPVLIEGCSSVTLPTWAFLVITAEIAPFAKSISYGEVRRPIPITGKLGALPPMPESSAPAPAV